MLGISALVFYLLATYSLIAKVLADKYHHPHTSFIPLNAQVFTMSAVALILNGILLVSVIFVNGGLDLGFSNSWGLISWFIVLLISFLAIRSPVENLLIIFFPLAILGLLLILFFPNYRLVAETASLGLKIHILLSMLAYSLLMVAACQSMLLALQQYQLHRKQLLKFIDMLPPMPVMEDFLLKTITTGFSILSLGLLTGLIFIHDIFAQHLVHKTILSLLSWLIFAVLLWGHWHLGWRGQKLSYLTISGFALLMLAFFGSKFVLETILMPV